MRLADGIVEALVAIRVRYVFGVSGANIEHLHDAIHRLGHLRIQSIMAKTEDGAAFMADGHARVHRTLGVCCSTSGGGMMNLVAGVAEANQSSVPLLAIVGQPPATVEGRGAFQDSSGIGRSVNAVQLFSAVTKLTRKVDRVDMFWTSMRDAIVAALGDRPGAAALLFPRSIYAEEVGDLPDGFAETIAKLIEPTAPDANQVQAMLAELRAATRPVLLVGQGAMRSRNPRALLDFADALDIPVATTMAARGEFPNDHRNYLGVLGVAGHPSAHEFVRDKSDLLLLAGAGLNTMTRAPFARDRVDLPEKRILAVTADPGELLRVVEPKAAPSSEQGKSNSRSWWPKAVTGLTLVIQTDVGTAFAAIHEAWRKDPFQVRARGAYVQTNFTAEPAPPSSRSPHASAADTNAAANPDAPDVGVDFSALASPNFSGPDGPLLQSVALDHLAEHVPLQGTLFYDAGNCAAAALHRLPVPAGVSTVIALGMGGMGYAIAGAVGGQLGAPRGHRTMVLTGDGSFLMVGMEIHTAVDLQLPILFVVFNNNMHGMCATRQTAFFESRYECVAYGPVDISQVARGFGSDDRLWVRRVSTERELIAALTAYYALPTPRPGVLELLLRNEQVPPFTPFLAEEAPTQPGLAPRSSRTRK